MKRRHLLRTATFLSLPMLGACGRPPKVKAQPIILGEYNEVRPFSFASHRGTDVAKETLAGKFWAVNFIFTSCATECPVLVRHFHSIQKRFRSDPRVSLVSITVDPQTDTIPLLANYANAFEAGPNWHFLRGKPIEVVRFMRESLLIDPGSKSKSSLPERRGNTLPHSDKMAIVDGAGIVRFYTSGNRGGAATTMIEAFEKLLP